MLRASGAGLLLEDAAAAGAAAPAPSVPSTCISFEPYITTYPCQSRPSTAFCRALDAEEEYNEVDEIATGLIARRRGREALPPRDTQVKGLAC